MIKNANSNILHMMGLALDICTNLFLIKYIYWFIVPQ
jgi:hypothetical protein